jgi:hypothetical protein
MELNTTKSQKYVKMTDNWSIRCTHSCHKNSLPYKKSCIYGSTVQREHKGTVAELNTTTWKKLGKTENLSIKAHFLATKTVLPSEKYFAFGFDCSCKPQGHSSGNEFHVMEKMSFGQKF